MSVGGGFTEPQLAAIERGKDPESIPGLVRAVRQLQHELDRLTLGLDVARRDREELRAALLRAREEAERREEGTNAES